LLKLVEFFSQIIEFCLRIIGFYFSQFTTPYFTYLLEELPKIINEGCTTMPDKLPPWSEEVHQKLGM
jgi:hypothetical protein